MLLITEQNHSETVQLVFDLLTMEVTTGNFHSVQLLTSEIQQNMKRNVDISPC